MTTSVLPRLRNVARFGLLALLLPIAGSCATQPPPTTEVVTAWDDVRKTDVVRLPATLVQDTWDGRIEFALEAASDAGTGLLTVERRSESFHYKECRKMALELAPDRRRAVEVSYRSDLDLDLDDRLETFRTTLEPDDFAELVTSPQAALVLCDDPFPLGVEQRQRVADFLAAWQGEAPAVQKETAPGEPEAVN